MDKTLVFSLTVPLVSHQNGENCLDLPQGSRYNFSIPFPTYVSGQTVPLPPSYAAIHPGVSTEVSYYIQVDVIRKGVFRRHEV